MASWLGRLLAPSRLGWPVTLVETGTTARGLTRGPELVVLRPLRGRDEAAWQRLRVGQEERLAPWEATLPPGSGESQEPFRAFVRHQNAAARRGEAVPFALDVDGELAGQVTAAPVEWGATRSAMVGYWISERWAGRGVMTLAVAMTIDFLLGPEVGLHRVEVNVRPENGASLAVCRKLVLREEGVRRRFMHIDGAWADHRSFAVTAEELGAGAVAGLEARLGR